VPSKRRWFRPSLGEGGRLEQALSDRASSVGKYLVEFLQLSSKKHILEKKNMGSYSTEALVSSLIITTETKGF
jgi:hypothetical protein